MRREILAGDDADFLQFAARRDPAAGGAAALHDDDPGLGRALECGALLRGRAARREPGRDDAARAGGARGIVSAGFAPGSPTPEQRAAFERAAKSGVVVVQCSRAASGRVAPRRRLRESGIVAGEDLSPQKARILLMLALSATSDIGAIQQAFSTY